MPNESRDLTPHDPRPPEDFADRPPPQGRQGPAIDHPELGVGHHLAEPIEPGPPPLTEADVERWLDRLGRIVAWVMRRVMPLPEALEHVEPPPVWRFTDEELADLAPPATRVFNRRLLWLSGVIRNADEIELGFLLLEYVDHNLERVREAREAEEAAKAAHLEETRADLEPGAPERGPGSFGLGEE